MKQSKKSALTMVKEILNNDINTNPFIKVEHQIVLTEAKR